MQLSERWRPYRADRAFSRRALGVMLPVAVQQLINSLFNMVDNLMVGSLDLNGLAMSAVSVANKPYTIFTCLLFGLTGGAGLMISQYYGAEDHKTCQGLFSLQVFLSLAISVVFFVLLQLLPRQIMGLFVKDENTILLGLSYLAVVSVSYLPTSISNVCVLSLRSIGLNRLPMMVSLGTITTNAVCNYILIFGKLGAPAMGVAGAAWGTLIARMLEMLVYLALLGSRRMYFSWNLRAALRLPGRTVRTFFVKASPLVANELLWSVGLNLYFWCYARLDEASLPAISIAEVCNMFASILASGTSAAVSVLIGTELGANRLKEARESCKKLLGLDVAVALSSMLLSCLLSVLLPQAYQLTPELRHTATLISLIMSVLCPLQFVYGFCFFCLRAGGDTRNAMLLDSGYMWAVPVPAAVLMGIFLPGKISLWVAVLIVQFLMYAKVFPALWILKKGKWVKNITV